MKRLFAIIYFLAFLLLNAFPIAFPHVIAYPCTPCVKEELYANLSLGIGGMIILAIHFVTYMKLKNYRIVALFSLLLSTIAFYVLVFRIVE